MVKRDLDKIIFSAVNTPPMVKRLQEQISILDLAFGAKNLIFARNAVNTPPPSLTDLVGGGVFTANTTVMNFRLHGKSIV